MLTKIMCIETFTNSNVIFQLKYNFDYNFYANSHYVKRVNSDDSDLYKYPETESQIAETFVSVSGSVTRTDTIVDRRWKDQVAQLKC